MSSFNENTGLGYLKTQVIELVKYPYDESDRCICPCFILYGFFLFIVLFSLMTEVKAKKCKLPVDHHPQFHICLLIILMLIFKC